MAAALVLCSCNNGGTENSENDKDSTKVAVNTAKKKIVKLPFPITDNFNHITSIGGIDIVYTQGDYHIEVEGDSALLQHIQAEVESGVLTINIRGERNKDINIYEGKYNVTAYISSPDLKCVAICSTGNFTSKGLWEVDDIELGTIGTGAFNIDSICCATFKYQSTGTGDATFNYLEANDKLDIACMAANHVNANVNTSFLTVATNSGKVKLSGIAKNKDIAATKETLVEDNTNK